MKGYVSIGQDTRLFVAYFVAVAVGTVNKGNPPARRKAVHSWHAVLEARRKNEFLGGIDFIAARSNRKATVRTPSTAGQIIQKTYRIVFQDLRFGLGRNALGLFTVLGDEVVRVGSLSVTG